MIEVAMGHILGQHDDFRRKKKKQVIYYSAKYLLIAKLVTIF